LAQRSSRKRRKQRQRSAREPGARPPGAAPDEADSDADRMARGYARGRAKDEAARAALVPLAPGERPRAVTVGAIAAAVAAVANTVSLAISFDSNEPAKSLYTVLGVIVLVAIAAGMWRARYWAVLGLQTLLALTILIASVAVITAGNLWAVLLVIAIIVPSGALFWFLVKSMARIQMPQRPGA